MAKRLPGLAYPSYCIYRNQPLMLISARWAGRRWVTFLVVFAILLAPRLLLAIQAGTLGTVDDLAADLGALLLGDSSSATNASVPLLRDYADLAIVVLMAAHTAHMVGQWRRINSLPPLLREAGLLAPELSKKRTFDQVLGATEARFNSPVWELVAGVVAAAVVVLLARTAVDAGIYQTLPGAGPAEHFAGWWANPSSHPASFGVVLASYWLYFYLVFRHSIMGIQTVLLLGEARRVAAGRGQVWLGYSSPWKQVERAVSEVAGALYDVMISITVLVSAFLIGTLCFSLPTFMEYGLVLPYVLLNPLFLVVPSLELNHRLSESWRRLHDVAVRELGTAIRAARSMTGAEAAPAGARISSRYATLARVETLPQWAISWRELAGAVIIYFIPPVALIPAFLGK